MKHKTSKVEQYESMKEAWNQISACFELNPKKKLRKGSKMTLGEWCDKEGFPYYTEAQTKELEEYVCQRHLKN